MPLTIQHSKTATTPDNTTAEIRPSHWNEQHLVSMSLAASEVIKYVAASGSSQSSGTISFANSNGLTFGLSNGTITASVNALTSQSVQTQGVQSIAAGGNTATSGGVVFSNSNNVSFGMAGSVVTASASAAAQTNQTIGVYASSQTTGAASSSTIDARSLTVVGAGGVSVGISGGSLVVSGATGGAADGFNRLAAGTQTAGTNTTVQFANSNGITFGMSGSNQITASHDGLLSHLVSAPNGSSSVVGVSFANSNGVTWSVSNGSIVASVDAGGVAQTITQYATGNTAGDASTGAQALSSIVVRGAGVASVGYSNDGAMIISVPAGGGGGDGGNVLAAGTQTATTLGTVLFENSNGITFGMSGSTRITASHNGLTTAALSNHSHGNPTLNLTNLTGTTASASNGLTLSLSAAAPQTAASIYAVSNTTQSSSITAALSQLSFAGAGAVSVGASNGSVIISAAAGAQSAQTVGVYASSQTTGQSSSSTIDARSLSVRGAGVVSVGMSAGELIISATAAGGGGADGGVFLSAAGSSQTAGNIIFSNSNGVSFGMNGSTVTASHNGLTTAAASNHSHGFSAQGGSSAFQTLSFSNTNGVSFSNSNGQVVASVATTYAASNHSHGNPTLALTNLSGTTASASNGLTLSLSANAPGAATLTVSAVGNTTVNSSGTWANAVSMRGYGVLSIGTSNGSLLFSTPDAVDFTQLSVGNSNLGNTAGDTGVFTGRVVFVGSNNITLSGSSDGASATLSIIGGAGGGGVALSAGTQSVSTGTVVYSNSNNITFGMSGSSRVTASYAFNVSAGTTSNNLNSLSFSNGSGVSFGLNAGTMTASVAAQTAQTLGLYASSNTTAQSSSTTVDARTLSVRGAGGVSVGYSAGELVISGASGGGAAVTASAANGSYTVGTLSFSNANGVSFGTSAGSAITASVAAQTNQTGAIYVTANSTGQSSSSTFDARTLSMVGDGIVSIGWSNGTLRVSATQSNQAASASNGSFTFQTLNFSNANNVTFGSSAGGIVTASVLAQTNQSMGIYASSNTTAQSSSSTVDARSLSFRGVGAISVGMSAGEVILSAAAGAQSNQTLGLYATGNTTQNSSTTFDARTLGTFNGLGAMTVGFSNGSVQLSAPAVSSLSATGQVSISTNGSTISIGVPNPTTDTGGFFPSADLELVSQQQGNGTIVFDPETFPTIAFDRIAVPLFHSNTSNSSGSHSVSLIFGLYSRNASTLSLISSTSSSTNFSASGTQGSYSLYSGIRLMTIPLTMTVTGGKYWMAFASITTTGGAAGQTVAHMAVSNIASNFVGMLGSSHATTAQFTLGQGVYTATSAAMPASVAFSQIRGSDSGAQRPPAVLFFNGTV